MLFSHISIHLVLFNVVLSLTLLNPVCRIACLAMELGIGQSGAFKLSKEGFVLLQFAPASGVRMYDWSRKQVFNIAFHGILLFGSGLVCEDHFPCLHC